MSAPRLALTLLALAGTVLAQDAIVFEPRDPEAPAARVGGSIRGAQGELSVAVLAPDRLAVTAAASPSLYWFASSDVEDPVELVLVEEGGEEPLVEVVLEPPLPAGIHAFPIPDGKTLSVDTPYQWSVAVVPDPAARSNDVFASALMRRIEPPAPASNDSDPLARAKTLASQGIWYDAIDVLSSAVAEGSDEARRLRASLLAQVGLEQIARFERQEMTP